MSEKEMRPRWLIKSKPFPECHPGKDNNMGEKCESEEPRLEMDVKNGTEAGEGPRKRRCLPCGRAPPEMRKGTS